MADRRVVHLVDDDATLRDATAFFLETADYDVHAHPSGESFLDDLGGGPDWPQPCCILMDIHMPGLSGLEVQLKLNERQVPWPVIILTGQADVGIAIQAMKNGAFDFFEKPYDSARMLEKLEKAFGKLERSHDETTRVANAQAAIARLSKRERQVMSGLLAALPNKLIAHQLDISVRTVEIYRAKLMDKLEARGLSEAVRIAIAAGMEPLVEHRPR
jgi:two-component system response regulator FixJ